MPQIVNDVIVCTELDWNVHSLVFQCTLLFNIIFYKPPTMDNYAYPDWGVNLGWLITFFPIGLIVGFFLYYFCKEGGYAVSSIGGVFWVEWWVEVRWSPIIARQPLMGLLSWCSAMMSILCNWFEDRSPVGQIYGCPIFECWWQSQLLLPGEHAPLFQETRIYSCNVYPVSHWNGTSNWVFRHERHVSDYLKRLVSLVVDVLVLLFCS